jgi:hypothetical protein
MLAKHLESLDLLKTEEGQIGAVVSFGSAPQRAQRIASALAKLLLTCNQVEHTSPPLAEFEALDRDLQKRPLGNLLNRFHAQVTTSDDRITIMWSDALERRNFLMHAFSWSTRISATKAVALSCLPHWPLLNNSSTTPQASRGQWIS